MISTCAARRTPSAARVGMYATSEGETFIGVAALFTFIVGIIYRTSR